MYSFHPLPGAGCLSCDGGLFGGAGRKSEAMDSSIQVRKETKAKRTD